MFHRRYQLNLKSSLSLKQLGCIPVLFLELLTMTVLGQERKVVKLQSRYCANIGKLLKPTFNVFNTYLHD